MVYKCYKSPPNTFEKSEPKKNSKKTKTFQNTSPETKQGEFSDFFEWLDKMPVDCSEFSHSFDNTFGDGLTTSDSLGEQSSSKVINGDVIANVAVGVVTRVANIEKLIVDLKAQQKQQKELGKIKKNAQNNKSDPKFITEKKKHTNKLAQIRARIKYEQLGLHNIKNPLPKNIDEANSRVFKETEAENLRRTELSMTILPDTDKTIRFFKGIAKKINNRGVSYSATILNNGHPTMLGSWNNYRDAVLTLDHANTLKNDKGVLFYETIGQDKYYNGQMAKRLSKKGQKLTMPTFLPLNNDKRLGQLAKNHTKVEKTRI